MILDELAASTRKRVEKEKREHPLGEIKKAALQMKRGDFEFEKAVAKENLSFICEVKKASPSKGLIAPDFPYLQIAREYEAAGADCVSVLTEPEYFLGSKQILKEISESISLPIIRKDFTIDEYMIYDAKLVGASCVLLICSLLDSDTIKRYISICEELGISALVEAHDEREIETALAVGARMIGVNNRDLKTFNVNVSNSATLRSLVPDDVLFVAESGIKNACDIKALGDLNVDAVLIGETLMRSPDKSEMMRELKSLI